MNPEEVKRFAEICGWHYGHCDKWPDQWVSPCWWSPGPKAKPFAMFPDFLNSKDAVIEALERFCKSHELLYEITQTNVGYIVDLDMYTGRRLGGQLGDTMNEAIIRAVLQASESQKEQQ